MGGFLLGGIKFGSLERELIKERLIGSIIVAYDGALVAEKTEGEEKETYRVHGEVVAVTEMGKAENPPRPFEGEWRDNWEPVPKTGEVEAVRKWRSVLPGARIDYIGWEYPRRTLLDISSPNGKRYRVVLVRH